MEAIDKRTQRGAENDSQQTGIILVVGDWIVDEHWVTGIHRSMTSSRVGQVHSRTLHGPQSCVVCLAGAGKVASVLYQTQRRRILGVGMWHPADGDALARLLDPSEGCDHTPHQVTHQYAPHQTKMVRLTAEEMCGTTRVIRVYQRTGSKVELKERIDWEVETPKDGWATRDGLRENRDLANALLDPNIEAVVIKDMCKGVISKATIEFIVDRLKDRQEILYFLSSKEFAPDYWKNLLKPVRDNVRLLMIPPVAAQHAQQVKQFASWIVRPGDARRTPSKEALEIVRSVGESFPNAYVVALPDDRTLLARSPTREPDPSGLLWRADKELRSFEGSPMASVLFPAMIAHYLDAPNSSLEDLVRQGLNFLLSWISKESGRVVWPDTWRPETPELNPLHAEGPPMTLSPVKWHEAQHNWQQALEPHLHTRGVIGDQPDLKHLELWRAMLEVDNYVCLVPAKREVLRAIIAEFNAFKSAGTGGHRGCLLIASPGSGKTHLASRLAEHLGLGLLEFNITQMLSKADLLDCFDTIVTTQFQNRDKRFLVFVDEINAKLDNQEVYSTFLAPLEKGVYRRAGKTFQIAPCAWLFASTKDPEEPASSEDGTNKASDFVSRLTLPKKRFPPCQHR